jgi:hypothetical protein
LQDQLHEAVDLPRLAHAAWVPARAAKAFDASAGEAATRTLMFLLGTVDEAADGLWLAHTDNERSVAEIALLTLALCETSDQGLRKRWVPRLAAALWSRIDAHDRVSTYADEAAVSDAYQDYFPGQVLLALANPCLRRGAPGSRQSTRQNSHGPFAITGTASRPVRCSGRCRGWRRPAWLGGGSKLIRSSPNSPARLPTGSFAFSSKNPARS